MRPLEDMRTFCRAMAIISLNFVSERQAVRLIFRRKGRRRAENKIFLDPAPEHFQGRGIALEKTFLGRQQHDGVGGRFVKGFVLGLACFQGLFRALAIRNVFLDRDEVRNLALGVADGGDDGELPEVVAIFFLVVELAPPFLARRDRLPEARRTLQPTCDPT